MLCRGECSGSRPLRRKLHVARCRKPKAQPCRWLARCDDALCRRAMRQGADWLHAVRSLARTTEFASDQSSIQVPRCRRSGCQWAITRFFTATLVRIISSKSWSRRPNRSKRCGSSVTKRARVTTRTAQRERYQPKAARQPDRIRTAAASYPRSIRAASVQHPHRIRAVSAPYPRHIRKRAGSRSSRDPGCWHGPIDRIMNGCCADVARMLHGCCTDAARMLRGCCADAARLRLWSGCRAFTVRLVPDSSALSRWSASRRANVNEPIVIIGTGGRRCPPAGLRMFRAGDGLAWNWLRRIGQRSTAPEQRKRPAGGIDSRCQSCNAEVTRTRCFRDAQRQTRTRILLASQTIARSLSLPALWPLACCA